jgi:hypothetical protein
MIAARECIHDKSDEIPTLPNGHKTACSLIYSSSRLMLRVCIGGKVKNPG